MNRDAPADLSAAPVHPIAVVAERTGLSRDLLRVWERRYGAVDPARSAGGQRLYSDADVERFRLLAAATRHGRSISQVAAFSNGQLAQLIADDATERRAARESDPASPSAPLNGGPDHPASESAHAAVDILYARIERMDGAGLDRELRRAITEHGLPIVLDEILPALMWRVGAAWEAQSLGIAHEHLASAAVMAVVSEAMRAVPDAGAGPRLLVATPSGDRHGLGGALVAAAAALDGWSIVQLGVDVPAAEIVAAAEATHARAVAVSIVHAHDAVSIVAQVHAVRDRLSPDVALLVGGAGAITLRASLERPGIEIRRSLAGLRGALAELAGRAA